MSSATEKKITLLTGTSRGIGLGLAEHYLKMGHRVIGVSRSKSSIADSNYSHFAIDISNESAVVECFEEIRKNFGYLTNLINNAGISSLNHGLLMPISTVRKILEVNYVASFLFSQQAARLMRPRGFGRIVNLSSVAVPLHSEGLAAYAGSKAAVEEMTRILAKELGPFGITVNCLGPSLVETQLAKGLRETAREELISRQTVGRQAELQDVSNAIDFFLSEQSAMISAQTIYLGGLA